MGRRPGRVHGAPRSSYARRRRPPLSPPKGDQMPRVVRSRLFHALFAGLALATLGIGLLGGLPAEAQRRKVLNIAAKEPDSLDPHTSTIGQSQAIVPCMYRGL